MTTNSMPDLTSQRVAAQKVRLFERQFGSEYRLLAYYAALPLVLTPELVHYLRINFLLGLDQQVPWEAEADLLLSDLCSQVGYELYAMDTDVRAYLLQLMKQDDRVPADQMFAVARVLISYVDYLSRVNPGQRQQELQAQRWAAMTYLGDAECDRVVAEIIKAFVDSGDRVGGNDIKAEFARLAQIIEKLIEKLKNYPELVDLAENVSRSLTDPSFKSRREHNVNGQVVIIPWVDRQDDPLKTSDITSFEFDVDEFIEVPEPLRRIPYEFEVATIELRESRNLFGRKSTPKVVINRRTKEDWQYVETLEPKLNLELVKIPAGIFVMGALQNELEAQEFERPQHSVNVPEFYMGKYSITQAQWRFGASLPRIDRELDPDPSRFKGQSLPVERVSWLEAIEFCARLSVHTGRDYGLPSEAEWEYACRAGTVTPFHFGETIDPKAANYNGGYIYGPGQKGTDRNKTIPVGSLNAANEYGLHDMHGNVWEWCQDHWHNNYQGAPENGSAWINTNAGENKNRVLRGGSWDNNPRNCRSAVRNNNNPVLRNDLVGFRVVSRARTS
jgi:formylglycine-generating enzyme required for sulfatase activity